MAEPQSGITRDIVDLEALQLERIARPTASFNKPGRVYAVLGRAVPGVEVVIRSDGEIVDERRVGEVCVRGSGVTRGYYNNADETETAFVDGELATGDLGYWTDDRQLVICGRIKDVIVVRGRNILPADIEAAAASVDGVRPGAIVAIAIAGTDRERLVVVAESAAGQVPDAKDIEAVVSKRIGVTPDDVRVVPKGSIPKTTSGKVQRGLTRERYEAGVL